MLKLLQEDSNACAMIKLWLQNALHHMPVVQLTVHNFEVLHKSSWYTSSIYHISKLRQMQNVRGQLSIWSLRRPLVRKTVLKSTIHTVEAFWHPLHYISIHTSYPYPDWENIIESVTGGFILREQAWPLGTNFLPKLVNMNYCDSKYRLKLCLVWFFPHKGRNLSLICKRIY